MTLGIKTIVPGSTTSGWQNNTFGKLVAAFYTISFVILSLFIEISTTVPE